MRITKPLLVLLWACVFSFPARSQSQDVQELKDQLSKLESEIAQLKTKISAIESGKAPAPAPPAQEAPITTPSVVANKTEEQVPMEQPEPVPENSFDLYGFAMLDSGYDFRTNDPLWFDVVRPTKLPWLRLQDERPALVRRCPPNEITVLSRSVCSERESLFRRPSIALRPQNPQLNTVRRSEDHLRIRIVRHRS